MWVCGNCDKDNYGQSAVCATCRHPRLDDPRIESFASSPESASQQRRVSVSRAARNTGIGLELLSLCQMMTDDGNISLAETDALREWLAANGHVDMPAIGFLKATVERIVEDGIVTDDERRDLFLAIEKVLPPDLRKYAVAKRKDADSEAKRIVAEAKRIAKEEEKAKKDRNRPAYYFNFMVAGTSFEGRGAIIQREARVGVPVRFVREPHNKYSRNAIAIYLPSGSDIGYVPESEAAQIAAFLDAGFRPRPEITKILDQTRNRINIPIVSGELYQPDPYNPIEPPQPKPTRNAPEENAPDASQRAASGCFAVGCLAICALVLVIALYISS